MSEKNQVGLLAGLEGVRVARPGALAKARWALAGLVVGLLAGAWIGGGPDRYGEADGILGGVRGAFRTLVKGGRYAAASIGDCVARRSTSVRRLGLAQQVETRLWQDKRLAAEGIVVEVDDEGAAVLKGMVPDEAHKEKAVALAQDTRGVERVVDELAVSPETRTIETPPAPAVPTGVATGIRVAR